MSKIIKTVISSLVGFIFLRFRNFRFPHNGHSFFHSHRRPDFPCKNNATHSYSQIGRPRGAKIGQIIYIVLSTKIGIITKFIPRRR